MRDTLDKNPAGRNFRHAPSVASRFALAMLLSPLALFVFSLLGRYFFLAELVCNFRCQILWLLIPSTLILLALRRWWLGGLNVIAIAWCMVGVVWIYLPSEPLQPANETLKVMSFNVLVRNSEYQEVIESIHRIDPDVVSILECSDDWYQALEGLNEQYPYHVARPRWHGFGIAMYSKYPLSELEVVQLTKDVTDNPFVVADVTFGDQTIRLAAFHALSPINRYRMDLRNQQFVEVARYLAGSDDPTVVMGDFNCTPWSPFLNDFLNQTGYRDSRQGFGYQATWHAGYWPLRIPIDHAFVSDKIQIHSRNVGPNAGSDHFPIVFEISTIQ